MKKLFSLAGNVFYRDKWRDRSALQQYKHSRILPKNTYAPWLDDAPFQEIFARISANHTLVDQYRCYELWRLALQTRRLEGDIVEVGVWRGGTGAILAKAAGDTATVYLCDTFEGVVKAGKMDSVYRGGEHSDTSESVVAGLMEQLQIANYKIVKGIFPEEGGAKVDSEKIKICHIDVDVYQSAKDIFDWVWPKMVSGGVVVFDDYGFAACEGITTLVNELRSQVKNAFFVYNINGHGLLVKTG